jgi:hypothetical protein
VLICCERKVLLAGCWWLVCSERKVPVAGGWWLVCSERKVQLADKPNEQAAKYYPLVHIHYGKL